MSTNIMVEEAPASVTSDSLGSVNGKVDFQQVNGKDLKAPLKQSKVDVVLTLTGQGSAAQRLPLDLVAVLDISGSMGDEGRLERLIEAMKFVISKLGENDRLSIVTFSSKATLVCGLRLANKGFKSEIEGRVKALAANGGTNIVDGLKTGLDVLNTRKFTESRFGAIMLMSDGEQNEGGDAAEVKDGIDKVPVFTFAFGTQHCLVLKKIAKNSLGGTFSPVQDLDNLLKSFGMIMGLLVTVIIEDLELTLDTLISAEMTSVSSGSYKKVPETKYEKKVTIMYGHLSAGEIRTCTVQLSLPAAEIEGTMDYLNYKYSYRLGTKMSSRKGIISVNREGNNDLLDRGDVGKPMEKRRLDVTALMKQARVKGEKADLVGAKRSLNDAQNILNEADGDEESPLIKTLRYELTYLLSSLISVDTFNSKGRPFALSSESSHGRQRFAARGDLDEVQLFATPRVIEYLEQCKAFEENPDAPLPTAEDDAKKELAANPLALVYGPINYHIQEAIQALQAIANILNKGH